MELPRVEFLIENFNYTYHFLMYKLFIANNILKVIAKGKKMIIIQCRFSKKEKISNAGNVIQLMI